MKPHLLYTGLTALATVVDGQSLPYNPSNILLRPDSNIAYIFRPSSNSPDQAQLFAYDYSTQFDTASSSFTAVSNSLPFLSEGKTLAYTPIISADGNMTVVAGDCSLGAEGAQTWTFQPDQEATSTGGKWSRVDVANQVSSGQEALAGSNFLASGASFSQYANASSEDTTIYTFGGMCPQSGSTTDSWQKEADYSNYMLEMSPDSQAGSNRYDLSALQERGPPIAQAGATITGLQLAYSSRSNNGQQAQLQDFVLLGGHTQAAFINTSQVAVFSLPQASWSFMPVQQPSSARTDLAVKKRQAVSEVTPRSGHTAVLSESGDSIIVFGGWVGDVNTPASPQLAILDMGSGGDWSWQVPEQSGNGLAADTGIYGHGAAILPGNVMMVVGGYKTGQPASKFFRRSTQTASDQILFYNVTSSSWLDNYTPPVHADGSSSGPLSHKSAKVGLGTGLGFGAALLVSIVVFYFWYSRRLRRSREERQRALLVHSSDGSFNQVDQPFLNDGGFDGRGGDEAAVGRFWPTGGAAGSYQKAPEMQHTTGMFVNAPSPTRGLRKGTAGKNYQYQPAPRFDDKRINRGPGQIHPIAEQANEDEEEFETRSASDDLTDAERKLKDLERVLMTEDDPFADDQPNPLGSHPVSPSAPSTATVMRVPTGASRSSTRTVFRRPLSGDTEAANWTIARGPDEAIQEDDDDGRVSPTKSSSDERTSSTLSERSTRTMNSDISITRTMSTRTGALLAAAAAAYRAGNDRGNPSPTDERTRTMSSNGGRKSPYYFARNRSPTNGSTTPGSRPGVVGDADSFTTARSNFADLQNEGEALLGGRPTMDRDDPYQRAFAAQNPMAPATQPMNGAFGSVQQRRKPGLMGSLRRAINAVSTVGERSFSLTSSAEQYRYDPNSSSSSPTKERAKQIGAAPRRAVSDGGALLKQKRGQQDWENDKIFPPYHDDPDPNDWGAPRSSLEKKRAEEEWDVEGEASKRDVQVMFTIPKSRLRVVNDDMDRASLRSASDGAVSRHNSVKDLRREESLKALRARSEGDKAVLPATQEVAEETEKEKAA